MGKTSLWLKIICIPFAAVLLILAISGNPVLPIRESGASAALGMSGQENVLSEIIFYVT